MKNIKLIDTVWFTNPYEKQQCMGIVKAYDTITEEYKYYIGFGRGLSEEEDIKDILGWGTKYTEEQFKGFYETILNAE
jgi:hypothetical protein